MNCFKSGCISRQISVRLCVYNVIDCPSTKFMCIGSTISFIYIFINYVIKITPKVFFSLFSLMYFSNCTKNAGSSLFRAIKIDLSNFLFIY